MSESNKNELDKLFQSRLSNDTIAENGWNVPPIDLFDNAMDALEPKEKDRKPLWLPFIFGGLILGSLAFMFVYNNIMFDKLDTKIEHLQSQSDDLDVQLSNESTTPFINNINSVDQSINTEETRTTNSENTQKLFNNNLSKNNKNHVVNKQENNFKSTPIIKEDDRQRNTVDNNSALQSGLKNNIGSNVFSINPSFINNYEQNTNTFNPNTLLSKREEVIAVPELELTNNIYPIQSLEIDLLNKELAYPTPDQIDHQIAPKDLSKIRRFSPYLLAGTHLSSFSMKGDGMDNATLTKYDQLCASYQLGIGLTHTLSSKWSLDYSVSYKNLINHSVYCDETNYKKSNEYLNDYGSLMYSDEMSVVSPTGIFKENVDIPVQPDEMKDGDILENTTNTTQLFHIINTSLGANYNALRKGNFELYLSGGLGLNYILNAKQDMNTEVYFDDKLMASDSYSIQPSFNGNNIFYTGYAGIGFKYQVNPTLSLTLDNRFERSFNSLNTMPSANAPSTILNSFNSGLKIGFSF